MEKGIVIAGFAGIGKTTLSKKYKNVIDLESSIYKWDNSKLEDIPVEERKGILREENKDWPLNYINEIKKQMINYDIVLVWIHPDVLKIYDKYNIPYVLCYPSKNALKHYEQRYKNRGNNIEYINKVIDTYDMRIKQFEKFSAKKIILNEDETLEDYLFEKNYELIKKDDIG